jgi:glycosyltransferase involved in cell wall biosynthesis
MRTVRPWLQRTDVKTSRRVHYFIANSQHVANRIRKHYDREATVIYPPVDVEHFHPSARDDGYYLMVTAFAPYKRVDIAIEAFNQLGGTLRIIGAGQDGERLQELAGKNIEFLGWQSDEEVREAYQGCRALVFPGEEDFGIVPVEAMAVGKPVIAYGRGGVLETVVPLNSPDGKPPTGVFFQEQTSEALSQAVKHFEQHRAQFVPESIREHAEFFNLNRFRGELREFVRDKFEEFHRAAKDPT